MSLKDRALINRIKKAKKIAETTEILFSEIDDPERASMVKSNAFPPSKNGRGNRLKRPMFKLMSARVSQKRRLLMVNAFPIRAIMPMGPMIEP